MLPQTVDHAEGQSGANRDTLQRGVPYCIGGKAHDDERSPWAYELCTTRKGFAGIHVMQRGYGYDGIERGRFERGREDICVKPVDPHARVLGTRTLEDSAIDIERHHPGHAGGSKLRCQYPVTAADIQNVCGGWR